MLKINLTHLFDPSGIHWLKLGVGDKKTSGHLRKELVGTEPGQSYTEASLPPSARAEITHIHTAGKHLSSHGLHPKASDTFGLFENAVFLRKFLHKNLIETSSKPPITN